MNLCVWKGRIGFISRIDWCSQQYWQLFLGTFTRGAGSDCNNLCKFVQKKSANGCKKENSLLQRQNYLQVEGRKTLFPGCRVWLQENMCPKICNRGAKKLCYFLQDSYTGPNYLQVDGRNYLRELLDLIAGNKYDIKWQKPWNRSAEKRKFCHLLHIFDFYCCTNAAFSAILWHFSAIETWKK